MCELFAMSSRFPATIDVSLHELAQRGGGTGPHRDGWGVGHYEDGDVRLIREAQAAANSACLRFLEDHAVRSDLVICHVRKATRGDRTLPNTQPFVRALGGRMHLFAHNGNLAGIDDHPELPRGDFRPVGTTDSELAFCALLHRLSEPWLRGSQPPSLSTRLAIVRDFARAIDPLGPANFVYADGEYLFGHGNRRTHPDGMRPPGLHVSRRACHEPAPRLRTAGVTITDECVEQEVVLFASVPLTDDGWRPLDEGELVVAHRGGVVSRPP